MLGSGPFVIAGNSICLSAVEPSVSLHVHWDDLLALKTAGGRALFKCVNGDLVAYKAVYFDPIGKRIIFAREEAPELEAMLNA